LDTLNVQQETEQETEKESLKNEIADLTAERLKIHEEKSKVQDENQHLKENYHNYPLLKKLKIILFSFCKKK